MEHAPLPTEDQLARVRDAIGARALAHVHRIDGGLSCTMDVLSDGDSRLVLRRYGPWSHAPVKGAAAKEARALELLQRANIPAPAPLWIDTEDVFAEQALLISFVTGSPELTPSNPFDWAEQLAATLVRIHEVRLDDDDFALFPEGPGEDVARVQENLEYVLEHPLGEDLLRRRVTLDNRGAGGDLVFSHTDYWPGNTLWNDDDLVAVVDWESPGTGDRAMDVAYCALDIRYLGMDRVADRFIELYRELSGDPLVNLSYWEAIGLCRPMPDIAQWVPAWVAMGKPMTDERAREQYTTVLSEFLERTA